MKIKNLLLFNNNFFAFALILIYFISVVYCHVVFAASFGAHAGFYEGVLMVLLIGRGGI